MALENLEPGLQKTFQFGIAGRRNEGGFERVIDGLVIGDFVIDVGLVEFGTLELRPLLQLYRGVPS